MTATKPVKKKRPASTVQLTTPQQIKLLKMIIYGDSGVGKTTLVAQADDVPELAPVLMISPTFETVSIAHRSEFNVVHIYSDKDLDKALKILIDPKHGFKTVIFDSMTQLHKCLMRSLMKVVVLNNPAMNDVECPSQREWGIILERLQILTWRLSTQAGMNVILTATEAVERDHSAGGVPMSQPGLPGKLPRYLQEWADVVGRLTAKVSGTKVLRTLTVQPGSRYKAKDRFGTLGIHVDVLEEVPGDPKTLTFPKMYKLMFPKEKK